MVNIWLNTRVGDISSANQVIAQYHACKLSFTQFQNDQRATEAGEFFSNRNAPRAAGVSAAARGRLGYSAEAASFSPTAVAI